MWRVLNVLRIELRKGKGRIRSLAVRKALLVKYSYAFVVMPGGAGTLDELFEAVTLIQTGKIKNFPIVIMGTDIGEN